MFLEDNRFKMSNVFLLISQLIIIFVLGFIGDSIVDSLIKTITLTFLYFFGIQTVTYSAPQKQRRWLSLLSINIVLLWISYFVNNATLAKISTLLSVALFIIITVNLMIQLLTHKRVDSSVIISSINGYFLLGILGAVMFTFLLQIQGVEAFSFSGEPATTFHDMIYFSFVTVTSIGYGDISPVSPAAKSVTLFFGIVGQLYVTFLIAFLVGKYANSNESV